MNRPRVVPLALMLALLGASLCYYKAAHLGLPLLPAAVPPPDGAALSAFDAFLLESSLFSLPPHTQNVYRVLLTVPLGALLIVLIRNVVGFRTFGTFMPVLIALAFRETGLVWGVGLFVLILALGLAVRFYLETLQLLLVPRLAAVLICVVLLMALLSVAGQRLGLYQGLAVAL
ncbi:MAG TPA: 7TM domain-containing protein, partial [Methylococcaceae bacterium]|nr:7TM domain-containing protein [Methylococcaceae bacterium]